MDRISPRRAKPRTYIATICSLLACLQGAWAQSVRNPDVAADIYAARLDAVNSTLNSRTRESGAYVFWEQAGTEGGAPKYFTFTGAGLINYDSNPGAVATGAVGDWNVNPDLTLDFKKQILTKVMFTATLDANTNRYLSMTAGNRDEVSLQTKFLLSEEEPDFLAPDRWGFAYLNNKLTEDYNTGFGGPQVKFDDISVGYTNQYYFTRSFKKATPGNADNFAAFDLSVGRRQASPSAKNGTYLQVKFTMSHTFNDDWALSFSPKAKVTYRDSPAQRATLWSNDLVLAYTPQWLSNLSGRAGEIDFTESYAKNFSPANTAAITDNNISVTIAVKWPF